MTRPLEVDHLMIHVHDVDSAGGLFDALGFAVTPRSDFLGLSNRLVCFAPPIDNGASFLELIAVNDRQRAPAAVLAFLPEGEGPASIVVSGRNAHGFADTLISAGTAATTLDLTREWQIDDTSLSLAFSVCLPAHAQSPVSWSYIQHKTPWHYRQPTFLAHRNGATRLSRLLVSADDPARVAKALARPWEAPVQVDPASARVMLGHTSIDVATPLQLAERYEGLEQAGGVRIVGAVLEVQDLERLKQWSPGPWLDDPVGIHLPPDRWFGCLFAFEQGTGARRADPVPS